MSIRWKVLINVTLYLAWALYLLAAEYAHHVHSVLDSDPHFIR